MNKRILSILLSLAILLSVITLPTAAADYSAYPDMPVPTNWAYKALCAAIDNGLLQGSGGKLNPQDNLTRAQMATVINRAFGASAQAVLSQYTDVPAGKWYYTEIAKAVRMGTFQGSGGKMNPDMAITRQEAFAVLARAFLLDAADATELDRFSDRADVSAWAVPELSAMSAAGYINGSGGKLNPRKTITRQEFAQVMYNMLQHYFNEAGTYTAVPAGNLMINTPGVTLKDVTITGDLIIGEGVDSGDVTLDHVTLAKRLIIRGGGENSAHINDSTIGQTYINKTDDSGLRLCSSEGSSIEQIGILGCHGNTTLEGRYNNVRVSTDAPVVLQDANITSLTIAAAGSQVLLSGKTDVQSMTVNGEAEGAEVYISKGAGIASISSAALNMNISGDGRVSLAEISGSNSTVNTDDTTLVVGPETTGVTQNGTQVHSGQTVQTGKGSGNEHKWVIRNTTATCTNSGIVNYLCIHCGICKTEVVPATGHSFDTGVVTTQPTCTEKGVKTYTCIICNETKTEVVPATGHSFDTGVVTTQPTCTKVGVKTYTCNICRETKTEDIPATGHSFDTGVVTTQPTCTEKGVKTYTCNICRETKTEDIPIIAHEWDEGTVTKAATAQAEGEKTYTCIHCKEKRIETFSYFPYIVELEDGTVKTFSALNEALAEAGKHPSHNEPGEEPWTEYATIRVNQAVELASLTLPAGYTLLIDRGGSLSVTGALSFGASDYPNCFGMGAGRLIIDTAGELTLNGEKFYGAGGMLEPGASDPMLSPALIITSIRSEDGDISKQPALLLPADMSEEADYIVKKDLPLSRYFSALYIDGSDGFTSLVIDGAHLFTDEVRISSGHITTGTGTLTVPGGITYGFSPDSDIVIEDGGVLIFWGGGMTIVDGSAEVKKSIELYDLHMLPDPGSDEADYALTIDAGVTAALRNVTLEVALVTEKGASLSLSECNLSGRSIENNGSISIDGWVSLGGCALNNRADGTMELHDSMDVESANITNEGTIHVCADSENVTGILRATGADFRNASGGRLVVDGEFRLIPAAVRTVRYGDAEPQVHREFKDAAFYNEGSIILGVGSLVSLQATGEAVNAGRIENDGRLELCAPVFSDELLYLERVDGEPQSDEQWERFYEWDADREQGYWRIAKTEASNLRAAGGSFTNTGELRSSNQINLVDTTLTNTGSVRILAGDFRSETSELSSLFWWVEDPEEALALAKTVKLPDACVVNKGQFILENSAECTFRGKTAFRNESEGEIINQGNWRIEPCVDFSTQMSAPSTLLNKGKLTNQGNMEVQYSCILDNSGTFDNAIIADGDNWRPGYLQLSDGAQLKNSGILNNGGIVDDSDPEQRRNIAACINLYGSTLENMKDGILENNGEINADAANEELMSRAGADPTQSRPFTLSGITNYGALNNEGPAAIIRLCGGNFDNFGVLHNADPDARIEIQDALCYAKLLHLVRLEDEPEDGEDWNGFVEFDTDGAIYWGIDHEEITLDGSTCDAVLHNSGDIINIGVVSLQSGLLLNEGTIRSEGRLELSILEPEYQVWWLWDEALSEEENNAARREAVADVTCKAPRLKNLGSLTNGALTPGGEEGSGSSAELNLQDGALENEGDIINNGRFNLNNSVYSQVEDAKFETYNTGGTEFRGGSITIAEGSRFYNEGYARIIDEYYGADDANVCDLSGWPGFFTDGIENVQWYDYVAAVYSGEGMAAAEAAQAEKPEGQRYNRMDICADITVTDEQTLSGFDTVFLEGFWDDALQCNRGATLTVEGKLTLAQGCRLEVHGWSDEWGEVIPKLEIAQSGTLVLEERFDGTAENNFNDWINPGCIVLWPISEFVCKGTVENRGEIELWYMFDEEDNATHVGQLEGLPDNVCTVADVRTEGAFIKAAGGDFRRIKLREGTNIMLGSSVDISAAVDGIDIEWDSGLVVEKGVRLSLNGTEEHWTYLQNQGNVSIYGELVINAHSRFENAGTLEVGTIGAADQSTITIYGQLWNGGYLAINDNGLVQTVESGQYEEDVLYGVHLFFGNGQLLV